MCVNNDNITYVFILGKHRSGTTWLSNVLLNSHDISSVIDEGFHRGICESSLYSHFFPYVDKLGLTLEKQIELYSNSRYFLCSGADKSCLDNIKTRKDFIKVVASQLCRKNNTNIFLEKTPAHSLKIREIISDFPNAKFLVIKRNMIDVAESSFARFEEYKTFTSKIRFGFVYNSYYKLIDYQLKDKNSNSMFVNYEDLNEHFSDIFEFVNVSRFTDSISHFKKKSSQNIKSKKLSHIDIFALNSGVVLSYLMPSFFISYLSSKRDKLLGRDLPYFFYGTDNVDPYSHL